MIDGSESPLLIFFSRKIPFNFLFFQWDILHSKFIVWLNCNLLQMYEKVFFLIFCREGEKRTPVISYNLWQFSVHHNLITVWLFRGVHSIYISLGSNIFLNPLPPPLTSAPFTQTRCMHATVTASLICYCISLNIIVYYNSL